MKNSLSKPLSGVLLTIFLSGLCFTSGAQVTVWGYNDFGQLNVPASATNVIALAAGDSHCLALRRDGTVVAWGGNYAGQASVPFDLTNAVSVAAGSAHSLALRSDGTVAYWGHVLGTASGSTLPPEMTNVVGLALGPGAQHVLALRSDGTVVDWGVGGHGLDNIPPAAQHVVAVAAGSFHGLALRADGNVVAWGDNGSGQLNVPANATNIIAIAAGWYDNAALCADGTVLTWGAISSPSPTYGFSDVADLACPFNSLLSKGSLLALRRDGAMVEWPVTAPGDATHIAAIAAGSVNGLALVGSGPPVFPGLPVNRTVRRGTAAYLRMTAVGALPISYQWSCNGTNIPGATNSVLIQPNVRPEQTGNIYCATASNAFGVATSGTIMLYEVPSEVAIQPQTQTALLGANVTLNANALGQGPFSFQWRFNGINLDGATDAVLFLPYVRPNQSGAYSVTVSNLYGAVTSPDAALSVLPLLITGQPQSQTVPAGTNPTFSVAASGQQAFSYQWLWNGTNLLDATNASLMLTSVQFDQAGTYSAVLSNVYGAVTSFGAVLSVVPLLITSQTSAQTVSAGTDVTFSLAASGQQPFGYQWLWNGTNLLDTTNASLLLTNVQFSQTGNYSAVVSNVCGAVNSSGTALTVVPLLITSQPQAQTVPAGTTVTFSVAASGQQPFGYQWLWNSTNLDGATNASLVLTNVQLDQAGTYSVVVSNPYGSVSSFAGALDVSAVLITSQPQSQTNLPGANATFGVTASGQTPLSYQWLCNGTNVLNATNTSLVVSNVSLSQSGTYSVVISNSYGSTTSWAAALSVVPLLILSQPQGRAVNAGTSLAFGAAANGKQPFAYQWLFNGAPLPGATQNGLGLWGVNMSQAGTYSVVIANTYGSVTSSPAVLTVTPLWITSQPQSAAGLAGETVTFSVSAGGQAPLSYQWLCDGTNLADATNSALVLTNVQLNQAGAYFVIVSDPYGNVNSDVAFLTVAIPRTPPQIITSDAKFGFLTNKFGFNLSGALGQTIVVDGSTDLVGWIPLFTNTVSASPFYFSDPGWTNFPWRFYRGRLP